MTSVAVTGASGYLGRKVVQALDDVPDVTRVVGIDVARPSYATRKLEFYQMDVRETGLEDVVTGCRALVHLATLERGDPHEVEDTNVSGTRSALAAASAAGARFVLSSSVVTYGYHPDNALPMTEDAPARPAPTDVHAASLAEAEELVSAYPDAVILRLAFVAGPSVSGAHAWLVESPIRLVVDGYEPPFQAVHEDDAARAVLFAIDEEVSGVLNVASDDLARAPEEVLGQRRVVVDLERARRLLEGAETLGIRGLGPHDLPALMYPLVVSSGRLRALGFTFERTTADALREAAEARRGWVRVGRLRFRPRWVAAGLAGATAIVLGAGVRRRSRR